MNDPKNMNKILKLIKYKNPLNIYLKKWRNILPSNEREIERNDIIKEMNNIPFFEKENNNKDIKDKIINDEINKNNNKIYTPKNSLGRNKGQKQLFINNVQKRIKLKNNIMKFINSQHKKNIFYYFKLWKNKTLLNEESPFNTIITTNINKKKYIKKLKFIPGKKVLPFEKLESLNQPYKTKTPRLINNNIIFTLTENDQKDKLLSKLIMNKVVEENNFYLRKYINIWRQKLDNNWEKEINENKNNEKITYKKRKINYGLENINKELRRNKTEDNYNLYFKHKIKNPVVISSIKTKKEEENVDIKDNIINNLDEKKVIKKFILPMPNKEITKDCNLILDNFQKNEQYEDIKLNLNISDIKKTPKIPRIKLKNKNKNAFYEIIHNRNKTDFGEKNDRYRDINPEIEENIENNFENNKEVISDNINIISDNEEPNTISLKNDSPIENVDFGYNKSKNNNIIKYKKVSKIESSHNYNNGKNIGRNKNNKKYNFDSKHIKSKTFISNYIGIKNEANNNYENKIKKFDLNNISNKKEYVINYNELILCEEIIYKFNEAIIEPNLILNQ